MRMKIIPKENTTPSCHELFLLENCTMIKREDHPQLGNASRLLIGG